MLERQDSFEILISEIIYVGSNKNSRTKLKQGCKINQQMRGYCKKKHKKVFIKSSVLVFVSVNIKYV